MDYKKATEILNGIPQFVSGYGVDRCTYMLEKLAGYKLKGNYKIIHVAGSNGKGSVCAYIDNILRCNGYKTGLFTSPHLVTQRERIRISGELISEELFTQCFEIIKDIENELIEEGKIERFGYFDYFLGMSLIAFKKEDIDIMICETGLGGSKDSTNAIHNPVASVITTISLEHTAILGDTISKIATDKAGIIKENVPVIFFEDNKEAKEAILRVAGNMNSPATGAGNKDITIVKTRLNNIDFLLHNDYYKSDCFSVGTRALYQVNNAALALTALAVLEKKGVLQLNLDQTKQAVTSTIWEGRMEEVAKGVFVDGAHNPEGIEAFVKSVKNGQNANNENNKLSVLLFSVVKDKNFEKMIKILCESNAFGCMVITVIDNNRKLDAAEIKAVFDKYTDKKIIVEADIESAYKSAYDMKCRLETDLYCTGSLYLVGDIKKLLRE